MNENIDVTRLEWFLKSHDLRPAQVARTAGISRQHLLRLRRGRMEPTRKMMVLIQRACSTLTGKRVGMHQLFDIGKR